MLPHPPYGGQLIHLACQGQASCLRHPWQAFRRIRKPFKAICGNSLADFPFKALNCIYGQIESLPGVVCWRGAGTLPARDTGQGLYCLNRGCSGGMESVKGALGACLPLILVLRLGCTPSWQWGVRAGADCSDALNQLYLHSNRCKRMPYRM